MEDNNYSSVCFFIDWVFNLYPTKYYGDALGLKFLLEKQSHVLRLRGDDGEWTEKKFKLVVTIVEVKDEVS
jgi:hypothetical protein